MSPFVALTEVSLDTDVNRGVQRWHQLMGLGNRLLYLMNGGNERDETITDAEL